MADGYRYLQQPIGNLLYVQPTPKNPFTNETLLNTLLSHVVTGPPSPSKSPDAGSPGRTSPGMYSQNHQQGQHSRLNGAPAGQRLPMLYNYQQPGAHQHQAHAQHHQAIQQDHTGHGAAGAVLGHHSTYSSGVLSNASPFSGTNIL